MAKIPTILTRKEVANFSKIGDVVSSMLSEAEFQAERDATWILMDGRDVIGSDYAILKTGDAVTSHNIPDARGQFLRGLDESGTVDPDGAGRVLGDLQLDAFQGHWHSMTRPSSNSGFDTYSGSGNTGTRDDIVKDPVTDGVNDTPRTSSETRPKNITVNHFIKIYH